MPKTPRERLLDLFEPDQLHTLALGAGIEDRLKLSHNALRKRLVEVWPQHLVTIHVATLLAQAGRAND